MRFPLEFNLFQLIRSRGQRGSDGTMRAGVRGRRTLAAVIQYRVATVPPQTNTQPLMANMGLFSVVSSVPAPAGAPGLCRGPLASPHPPPLNPSPGQPA